MNVLYLFTEKSLERLSNFPYIIPPINPKLIEINFNHDMSDTRIYSYIQNLKSLQISKFDNISFPYTHTHTHTI